MIAITRAALEQLSRELIGYAIHKLGSRVGITVFVYEFGAAKNLAYISNGTRESMIEAVEEWLGRLKAGLTTDPLGPRAKS